MTVVLAGSYVETAKFARKQRLANIRHIVDRATLAEMSPFVASVVHVLPSFYDRPDKHGILEELNATRRQFVGLQRLEWTQADLDRLYGVPIANFAIDASPNAVPGQISVDEAIAEVQASQLAALKASAPVEKDAFLAELEAKGVIEPEGFALAEDPAEQAKQILTSAAHFADLPDGEPEPEPDVVEEVVPEPKPAPKPRAKKAPKPAPAPAAPVVDPDADFLAMIGGE